MLSPWKRAAAVTVTVSLTSSAILSIGGCKRAGEQADLSVAAELDSAQAVAETKNAEAAKHVQTAAGVAAASDASKAAAKIALADAESKAADKLMLQAERQHAQAALIASRVGQLAARIQANNVLIAGYTALEPKGAQEALAKQSTLIKSGAGDQKAWISTEGAPVPSQDAVGERTAALSEKLKKLEAQQADFTAQRTKAAEEGAKLRNASDVATGKQSTDLFKQAAAKIKEAADIQAQSDAVDNDIAEVKRSLAQAQAEQQQLELASAVFTKQQEQLATNWKQVEELIKTLTGQSQSLLDGSGGGSAAASETATSAPSTHPAPASDLNSIVAASAAMEKQSAAAKATREQALAHLETAKKLLAEASKLTDTVRGAYQKDANNADLKLLPQVEAWRGMMDVHNPSDMKLLQALLSQRYARLHSGAAMSQAVRAQTGKLLDAALAPAKLAAPEYLKAGAADAELEAEKKLADDSYHDADALLTDLQKSTTDTAGGAAVTSLAKSAKQAAQAVQIVELYAHAQFDNAVGNDKDASLLISQAKQVRDQAIAANVPLPSPLPAEIAPPPPVLAPTSGPATGPTAPATTPAAPTTTPGTPSQVFTPEPNPAAPATTPATPATPPATPPGITPLTPPATPPTTPPAGGATTPTAPQ